MLQVIPGGVLARVRRCADAAGAVLRRLLGAPDYERYLAHQRADHPGGTVLSRQEFVAARLADRYDRPGSRCC